MKRKSEKKTRAGGLWTEARFVAFVKSQLRGASWKWAPMSNVLKKARVVKGVYLCNKCKQNVPTTVLVNGKRIKNVFVDHIKPVVDPQVGFTTWDSFINNLFCEEDNLQLLCGSCHDEKTAEEKQITVEKNKKNKEKFID